MAEFKPASINPLPPMQAQVIGKIEAVRRYGGKNYARVICPAPDLYSKPSVLEIRSTGRLGQRDDEVNVVGRLGGYVRKPYSVKDKETGEISTIIPVDMTMDLVE
jgi:hypothetical protein